MKHGSKRHEKRDNGAHCRCDGRAARCKPRENTVAVDEKIIENEIYEVGGNVGTHADLRVSKAALRRIDRHAKAGKKLPAHDDAVIFHTEVDEVRLSARKGKQVPGKKECARNHQDTEKQSEHQSLLQGTACAFNVPFAFAPGNDGGNARIERDDGRHQ